MKTKKFSRRSSLAEINGVTRRFSDERTEVLEAELEPRSSEAEGQGVAVRKSPQ